MPPVAIGALVAGAATSIGIAAGVIGPIVLFETSLGIIGSGLFAAATSFALGMLSQALAPSLDLPDFSPLNTQERKNVRQFVEPVTPWKIVYGLKRVSGPMVAAFVTDGDSILHLVIVLASHELESIDTVMFNDEPIFNEQIGGDGVVTSGTFISNARIKKHLGTADQVADADLVSEVTEWTTEHRLRGRAYLYVRIQKNRKIYQGVPAISCWVRGKKVTELRDSAMPVQWTSNMALIIYDYLNLAKDQGGAGFDATEIDSSTFVAAANTCDEFVDTEDIDHTVASVSTADDWLLFNEDPGVQIQDGDRVQIASTDTLPAPLATVTDYYAVVSRIVGDPAIQLATTFDNAMLQTVIDLTTAGAGTITLTKTGEPRYHGGSVVDTGRDVEDILDNMRMGLAGRLAHVGDTWFIYPGTYVAPTITLDESDLRGNLEISAKQPRRDRFNAVKGTYSSPLNKGVPTSYPHVLSSAYETEDGGVRLFTDLNLSWTQRAHTAQRIAKIELERHRRQITVGYPTKISGFRLKAGDTVSLDNIRFGWSGKEFEVSEAAFGQEVDNFRQPILVSDLLLREHDAGIYTWTSSEETPVSPAARTNLPSAFTIDDPTNLTLTSGNAVLFLKTDGTVVSRIKAVWTDPAALDFIELEFKKSSDSDWEPGARVAAGVQQAFVWDAQDGEIYDVRIRAFGNSIAGPNSNYVTEANHTVVGKTAAPPDLLTFNVTRLADGTRRFTWTHDELPADVRSGGGMHIRFRTGTGWTWEDLEPLHTGLLEAAPYETNELAAGTYIFGIKMIDSSNNESASALVIEATLGDPRLRNVLVSRDENQLGWPGTIVNAFINVEGDLEAKGSSDSAAGTWGDLPDEWNFLSDEWKGIVANETLISYETPEIDLGIDVSFTPIISTEGFGDIVVTVATGTDADGGVPSSASFLTPAPVTSARYVIVRVEITGDSVNFAYLRSLIILLDSETQIESYEDIDTSAGSAGVFERIVTGHFRLATRGDTLAISQATITAFQNAGSGWTWELLDKATVITSGGEPAAEFKIYKDGTLTDATIDAEIKGPKG